MASSAPMPRPPARRIVTEEPATLDLPGGRLGYVLRRSSQARTLRVVIDPAKGVVVTVPGPNRRGWTRPEAHIRVFLGEREAWIRRHLARQAAERAALAARGGLRDGATFRYRGETHRLRLEVARGARRSTVTRVGGEAEDELVVRLASADHRAVPDVLEAWMRERARDAVQRAIARHATALGVEPAGISIRDQRTRWGSASRTRRLAFSWRLVLAPPEALDTVVIHELAHLRVFGHGPAFWALVDSRRPDHRQWRRWLRDHALELHGALDQDVEVDAASA
jgi:predicted metal-dependent hydrolase